MNGQLGNGNTQHSGSPVQVNGLCSSTGIGNEFADESTLSIYPNPASGAVFIESANQCSVEITNALGEIVLCAMLNAGTTPVDISSLSPGAYFIRANGEQLLLHKLIVE